MHIFSLYIDRTLEMSVMQHRAELALHTSINTCALYVHVCIQLHFASSNHPTKLCTCTLTFLQIIISLHVHIDRLMNRNTGFACCLQFLSCKDIFECNCSRNITRTEIVQGRSIKTIKLVQGGPFLLTNLVRLDHLGSRIKFSVTSFLTCIYSLRFFGRHALFSLTSTFTHISLITVTVHFSNLHSFYENKMIRSIGLLSLENNHCMNAMIGNHACMHMD